MATVVWRTEDGDKFAVGEEFVTFVHDLVAADYQIEVVLLGELVHDVGGEGD